ncbi:MAG: 3'-5' exonuclease [Campylobacterales bacterium]
MWEASRLAGRLRRREVSSSFFCEKLLGSSDCEASLQLLRAMGFPLEQNDGRVRLATAHRHWRDETFCFVDIETTGPNPEHSQILEIGALKGPLGGPYEEFATLIKARYIPPMIVDVTGITLQMVANAPTLATALRDFRLFLGDALFVAHDALFDYRYLSHALEQQGLGRLMNRALCTLKLSKKLIKAERYGLVGLSEALGLDATDHHRALADAKLSAKVCEIALKHLPEGVVTTEELIAFSDFHPHHKKLKKKKEKNHDR